MGDTRAGVDGPPHALPRGWVRLPQASRALIRDHGAEAYPRECCGVLVGSWSKEGGVVVRWARRARNVRVHVSNRYEIDPADLLRTDGEARREGLDIVGFYHSHPDHPPVPSAVDVEEAWPGYCYLIVAVYDGCPGPMGAWVFDDQTRTFSRQQLWVDA